jgi:hypothetical protein
MARNREDRFSTAAELGDALKRAAGETEVGAAVYRPAPPRPRAPATVLARTTGRWKSWLRLPQTRGAAVLVALLLVLAGILTYQRSHLGDSALATGTNREPLPKRFSIPVSSIPEGARIYLNGPNTFLGRTDTYLRFEIANDHRPSLLFRKEGYNDEIREVNPNSMLVVLRPVRNLDAGAPTARAVAPAPPSIQAPSAGFDHAAFMAVFKQPEHQASMKDCYERALKKHPRLTAGRLDVFVEVTDKGKVKTARTDGPRDFTAVSSCIGDKVRTWRFPPASAGTYSATFPLILRGSAPAGGS